MDVTLKHQPSFSLAVIRVGGNEQIKVEPGAMVSHSDGMASETKAEGGLFGGLKRMVAGESFFQNTWRAPASGGEITVAPTLPGDMVTLCEWVPSATKLPTMYCPGAPSPIATEGEVLAPPVNVEAPDWPARPSFNQNWAK